MRRATPSAAAVARADLSPSTRTIRVPSSDATAATSSSMLAVDGARQRADRCLAAAAECFHQSPLRFERHAGISVVDSADDLAGRRRRSRGFRRRRCPARATARTPWPAASCVMRDAIPRRRSPAAARTSASYSPASSFLRRVSRLPRMGANRAPFSTLDSCAIRRTLPVPMFGVRPREAIKSCRAERLRAERCR